MYIRENTQLPPFVPLPKFILQMDLTINAKMIYGLLLNRTLLSQHSLWLDEQGRVYVIYTVQQLAEDSGRSQRTVKHSLNELEGAGLIHRVRQGFQQANRIFVLLPDDCLPEGTFGSAQVQEAAPPGCKNCPSEVQKSAPCRGQNLPGSKKEHKYNDSSETEGETRPLLGPYQNVMLSEQQLLTLRQEFPDKLDAYIERLSAYMAQSGKRYASHEAVLRQWMIEDTKPKCQYHYDHVYEEGECL